MKEIPGTIGSAMLLTTSLVLSLLPGLFRILTDVPTGPVPLSVDLRSLASLVAPDTLFGQVLSLNWV